MTTFAMLWTAFWVGWIVAQLFNFWVRRQRQRNFEAMLREGLRRMSENVQLHEHLMFAPPCFDNPATDDDFAELTEAGNGCPACLRMAEVHRQHPKLTLAQLDGIIARQITEGRCAPHLG